jgi:hypothetical protein
MVVTTTFDGTTPGDNGYETGLQVRLVIPRGFGMYQVNGLTGFITKIDASSFSLEVDSTYFDAYVRTTSGRPGRIRRICHCRTSDTYWRSNSEL